MNEEAGFIAALLADPKDQTVLWVYADWLDERADPRAAYLRLLVEDSSDAEEVVQLASTLDANWVRLLATREFDVGKRVRICYSPFAPREGEIITISPDRSRVTVRTTVLDGRADLETPLAAVEPIE